MREQRRDLNAANGDRALVRQFAHLGFDLEADAAFRKNDRCEGKADTELLEGHTERTDRVDRRYRIFAAGEEIGRLTRYGRQVRLGERADQAVALERTDGRTDRVIAVTPAAHGAAVACR